MIGYSRRCFIQGLAASIPAGCVLDGELKLPMLYQPEPLDDGWPVGSPASVGIAGDAIEAAYERFFSEDQFITGRSLLFARRGVLVAEGYVRDRSDRDRLQHLKSVTKSLTSLLTGQALERGVLPGIDARLGDLLVEAAERGGDHADITVERLLTMRSGLDWENSQQTSALMVEEPSNSVEFVLERPLVVPAQGEGHYSDADPHLLGAAIARQAGESLERLARRWLLDPLGIQELRWENARDGIDYGAYGAWLRPRAMLRIGELCRLGGVWMGESVVPTSWLEVSTRTHLELTAGDYGYLWWPHENMTPGSFAADGHGGQYIYVVPEHELVCVQTALPYTKTHAHGIVVEETEELIRIVIDGLRD